MFNADKNLMEKWSSVLDHESVSPIQDNYKKSVTARLLENQEIALQEERVQSQDREIIFLKQQLPIILVLVILVHLTQY